jgi:hypothetical protein
MIITRRIKWARRVARKERKTAYMVLVGKPEGKRQLGKTRRRWEDNIKMELRYDGAVWTELIWLRIGTM